MASESGEPLLCDCGCEMKRIYTAPQVSVSQSSGYYNHGLGCYVRDKSDIKDAIKKIADGGCKVIPRVDEHGKVYHERVDIPGREVVEVGNEYKSAIVKPKTKEYNLPKEVLNAL